MKSFIFIVLSALFLGSAAYLGNMFLFDDRKQPSVPLLAPAKAPVQYALSLTQDVRDGDILEKGMLDWQVVPESLSTGTLLLKGETDMSEWPGAVLTRDMPNGSFIRKTQFILPTDPGYLKALLLEGTRARPVAIDNAREFDELRPGDRVDLILTYKAPAGAVRAGETVVKTILESVRIIGVGAGVSAVGANSGAPGTLTLALTPEDVELVSVAEAIGHLRISLRGENTPAASRIKSEMASFSASDLFPELKSPSRPVVRDTSREVRIFRGGETKVLTLTGGGQ